LSPEKETVSDEKSGFWEDIYGRTRDAAGNVVKPTLDTATAGSSTPTAITSKYVPPALRAQAAGKDGGKAAADAAVLAKLSKQVIRL